MDISKIPKKNIRSCMIAYAFIQNLMISYKLTTLNSKSLRVTHITHIKKVDRLHQTCNNNISRVQNHKAISKFVINGLQSASRLQRKLPNILIRNLEQKISLTSHHTPKFKPIKKSTHL